jgi:hypothetical protein
VADEYVIWKYKSVPFACVLKPLVGLEKSFRLLEGVPLQNGFPGTVQFHMDPDFPNDLVLPDNLLNPDFCIVASGRLAAALRARNVAHVEYLPVTIIDHKGRAASTECVIVHPVEPVDCIDTAQSVFDCSRINKTRINSFKKLVLDTTRIPADRKIFRLKGFWKAVVVRLDLMQALSKEGFTGLGWLPIQDYPEK